MILDAHCHLHEFKDEELKEFKEILILAVSNEVESSLKTIELAEDWRNVVPAVGIHPWEVEEFNYREVERIEGMVDEHGVKCLGEIGLDKKFKPETFNAQLKYFKEFLSLAKEYGLAVNLHAAGAWREVFRLTLKMDVDKALFHWFNGPIDLLRELESVGYYISINPALKIQNKHREIARECNLSSMLVESDGPYEYRGLRLKPTMVDEALTTISELKSVKKSFLESVIERNFKKLFL